LPFCQLAILSTCHFVNLPFGLAISSTWSSTIWPTCHLVNLPFHQLGASSNNTILLMSATNTVAYY
jgi:hypothetical protein